MTLRWVARMSSVIDTHSCMTPEEVAEYLNATQVTSDEQAQETVGITFKVRVTESQRKEISDWLSARGISGTFRRERDDG